MAVIANTATMFAIKSLGALPRSAAPQEAVLELELSREWLGEPVVATDTAITITVATIVIVVTAIWSDYCPGPHNSEFLTCFQIFQIFLERLQTSKTTTFGRLQNIVSCQNVAPTGTTCCQKIVFLSNKKAVVCEV